MCYIRHPSHNCNNNFSSGATACSVPGLPYVEASRSHSDTPLSVGLLWTSDEPDAETSTWQHTTLTDRHTCPRRGSNPQSQHANGHALNREATGIGNNNNNNNNNRSAFKLWSFSLCYTHPRLLVLPLRPKCSSQHHFPCPALHVADEVSLAHKSTGNCLYFSLYFFR